jgi:Fe-S cluster biogenesis protein NfuA
MNTEDPYRDRIEAALSSVRPYLARDEGDVELVRFDPGTGVLEIRWLGACLICPMSRLTLRAGVERAIINAVPEVKRVEAVSG